MGLVIDESDKVGEAALSELGSDSEIRHSLMNAHVRRMLVEIDSAKNKEGALKAAMEFPIFTEFADACLRVCGVTSILNPTTPHNHTSHA